MSIGLWNLSPTEEDRPSAPELEHVAGPGPDGGRAIPSSLVVPFIIAVALLLRAGMGYRSFPSIDDFVYVPLARAAANPALYPRDEILRGFLLHAPVWRWAVEGLGQIFGEALGFWLATVGLTVATVGATWRLLTGLGTPGAILPLAVLVGFCGRVRGIGRGLYDGAMGNAFHVQWLALVLLLWAYDAFLRDRPVRAGILLGCATAAHPVVGAHGAFVLAVTTALGGAGKWRQLGPLGLSTLIVSAPVTIPVARGLLGGRSLALPTGAIIRQGFLFRTWHEFSLAGTSPSAGLLLALTGLAGFFAVRILSHGGSRRYARGYAGLLLGHTFLILLTILFHGPFDLGGLQSRWLLPYLLHLSRTSPLFVALSGVAITAAISVRWRTDESAPRSVLARWTLVAVVATLLLVLPWRPSYLIALGAGLAVFRFAGSKSQRAVAVVLWLACAAALAFAVRHETLRATLSPDEAQLFAWARTNTSESALFITPPGLEGFRLYALRSIYVDFRMFPSSNIRLIPEWRRRIDLVSAPDRAGREALGWPAVPLLDRSYANRNTPTRIADLLSTTRADFFVWDSAGLGVPPFVPVDRRPDRRLARVFANSRFEVFRLTGAARHP